MNFQNWDILRELSTEFLDTVEMALVVGDQADTAFFITNDDKVFGIGSNINGCLGVGCSDTNFYSQPTEIWSLSKREVKGIVCGGDGKTQRFIVAHLNCGKCYYWGIDPLSLNKVNFPQQIPVNTLNKDTKIPVKKVVCCNSHCVVLSENGKVFTWGFDGTSDQLGRAQRHFYWRLGESSKVLGSNELISVYTNKDVIDISCGYEFSVALLADGRVLSWGKNDYGQLGLNGCEPESYSTNTVSTLDDIVITKVACGRNHVLALSKTGTLYAWGQRNLGQLGKEFADPSSDKVERPLELKIKELRVIDIGAFYLHNLSVAQCENGKVYVWGETKRGCIFEPEETEYKSIGEVFESFAFPTSKAMLQPMRRHEVGVDNSEEIIRRNENPGESVEPSTSDVPSDEPPKKKGKRTPAQQQNEQNGTPLNTVRVLETTGQHKTSECTKSVFDIFGESVSKQLQELPKKTAANLQREIQNILTTNTLAHLDEQDNM